jgi:peptidoglycan hydrolase-like protein with peptidoglycan-binding domain
MSTEPNDPGDPPPSGNMAAPSAVAPTAPASPQPPERQSATGLAAPTPELLEIEQLLDRLSFPPGKVDGVFDQDTAKAIEAYQQAAGLSVDGQPSTALLNELRDVAGSANP